MAYYDRYSKFRSDGQVKLLPFLKIDEEGSDLYIVFEKDTMRFDNLSYKYYGDADYAWLILQANPQIGGYEYSVADGTVLRIPYPLSSAINRYEESIRLYKEKNK
jgi:hypothetical protein